MLDDKFTVALDVDGVLANLSQRYLDDVRQLSKGEYDYQYTDRCSYYIEAGLDIPKNITAAVRDRMNSPGWCRNLPLMPGAKEAVERLLQHREYLRVIYVTNPNPHSMTWPYDRAEWLVEHFGAEREDIHVTRGKPDVHADLFIDDKPENVSNWLNRWAPLGGRGLVWHANWNKEMLVDLPRIKAWLTLEQLVGHQVSYRRALSALSLHW